MYEDLQVKNQITTKSKHQHALHLNIFSFCMLITNKALQLERKMWSIREVNEQAHNAISSNNKW